MTNETTTNTEFNAESLNLSHDDLDLVAGGLNPQPLPPSPPPPPGESRLRSRF